MKSMLSFWERFIDRVSEFFSSWPSHYYGLRRKVVQIVREKQDIDDLFVCALEGYYLPHGGKYEILICIDSEGGIITRNRTPMNSMSITKEVHLQRDESIKVKQELAELGVWELTHNINSTRDGWPCAVVVADNQKVHSIQTHNPDGKHRELIEFILRLAPIEEI